jgi:DNA-binding PadR family transcriptional regulator
MPPRSSTLPPHWFQILLALADSERHGSGIMQEVLERTEGAMRLWPGMLYRNLQQLAAEGLIVEVEGPTQPLAGSPRFFAITSAGRRACAAEAQRLAGFVAAARAKKLLKRT